MFFNQNGILNIDEAILNKESFKKIMEDGIVSEEEIKEQSEKVIGLFKDIENKFSEEQLRDIKDLLAETSVLYAVYNIYSNINYIKCYIISQSI